MFDLLGLLLVEGVLAHYAQGFLLGVLPEMGLGREGVSPGEGLFCWCYEPSSLPALERKAHFVPGHAAVLRCTDAFVYKAETFVVVHQMIFAGEHDTRAILGARIFDKRVDGFAG